MVGFLRGWVEFPTGGIAREPGFMGRSGVNPEPTVRVWMGEGNSSGRFWSGFAVRITRLLLPLSVFGLFF